MSTASFSTSLLACSGPRAGEIIAENTTYAFVQAAIVATLALAALWSHARHADALWPVIVLLGLLAVHPAWTISATSGDCGGMKAKAATIFTCLAAGIVTVQIAIPVISRWRKRT